MSENSQTLDQAVTSAVEQVSTEGTVETSTVDPAAGLAAVPVEGPKFDFDPVEAKQALQTLALLKDPKTAPDVLNLLAKEIGLRVSQGETPTKKDILKDLTASAPEELRFILEGLGPQIQELIREQVENQTLVLKQTQEQFFASQVNAATELAYKNVVAKFPDLPDFEKEMSGLMDELPMKTGAGTNVQAYEQYLTRLYQIASHGKVQAKSIATTVDRMNRNARSATVKSAETNEDSVKIGSRLPSLDEAVKWAWEGKKVF